MSEQESNTSEEQLINAQTSFERTRYEFCVAAYEREWERKEILERKSQFFLSLITLILGAIFLKLDALESLRLIANQSQTFQPVLHILVVVLVLFLLATIITVLMSMLLQDYMREYPKNIVSSMFDPNSRYIKQKTTPDLLETNAMNCALALEVNQRINDKKAAWVKISSICTLISTILLTLILFIITLVSVR